jgi:hypothetical protein
MERMARNQWGAGATGPHGSLIVEAASNAAGHRGGQAASNPPLSVMSVYCVVSVAMGSSMHHG